MPDVKTAIGDELVAMVKEAGEALQIDLRADLAGLSEFVAARVDHLALAVGQPGFDYALAAERDAILLCAASTAVTSADQIDARVASLIAGAIRIGARVLAAAAV